MKYYQYYHWINSFFYHSEDCQLVLYQQVDNNYQNKFGFCANGFNDGPLIKKQQTKK